MALVLDVSGSCINHFPLWQELVNELVEEVPEVERLELVYHNHDFVKHDTWERSDGDEVELSCNGSGGTDHRRVLQWVEDNLDDIDSILMFTDCETCWPDEEPELDCVTVLPRRKLHSRCRCPFGVNVVAD